MLEKKVDSTDKVRRVDFRVHATPDPLPKRRTFTSEFKLAFLDEVDACTRPGEISALLKREGLYSSYLVAWRRQRDQGLLEPGREAAPRPPAMPRQPEGKPAKPDNEVKRAKLMLEVHQSTIMIF